MSWHSGGVMARWEIGPDGFPTDPNHPFYRQDGRSVDERREARLHRRFVSQRRAWEAGNMPALEDALRLSRQVSVSPPDWALDALEGLLRDAMRGTTVARRGRTARPSVSYREDMKHFERWELVRECREWDDDRGEWARKSLDNAYSIASEYLGGTDVASSEDTIKRSYRLVERAIKRGLDARFYVSPPHWPKGVRKPRLFLP